MPLFFLISAALFVAYANGGNDNFKGVATLYGGKVLSYKNALRWATITTFAGALTSFSLGGRLLKLFSGKSLFAPSILNDPSFLISVAVGAAATVLLATLVGLPISTTHSLVGGLTGAGLASGGLITFTALGKSFFLPLVFGPIAATTITMIAYSFFHFARKRTGIESNFCLCIRNRQEVVVGTPGLYSIRTTGVQVAVEEERYCRSVYNGKLAGINVQKLMDILHVLSAGAVCFSRALNDTPKITALLLTVAFLPSKFAVLAIAIPMLAGGIIHSRKIARKMGLDITEMNPGQAFTANIVTAGLMISGSVFGLPLSTTHVSCGSIFGIGAVSGQSRTEVIFQIVAAWLTTLPIAALLSAAIWYLLSSPTFSPARFRTP